MRPWEVVWTFPFIAAFERLHWRDASIVCGAVIRLAETGLGRVGRIGGDERRVRLYVHGYAVRLDVDAGARLITVWWVARARR